MLASCIFGPDDQISFAKLTGDFNPVHLDPLAARRTQAGAPVVHGIHSLMWLFECIAARHPEIPAIRTLKARFSKMIFVGDRVEGAITQLTGTTMRAELRVDGVTAVQLNLVFGPPHSPITFAPEKELLHPTEPRELRIAEMKNASGYLPFANHPDEYERRFPAAARLLGARRIAALGCSSYLVGMVVPGLHSIYSNLALDVCEDNGSDEHLSFRVVSIDPRFSHVRQEICGCGLSGTVDAFVRAPPTAQSSINDAAKHVANDEFADATVLIIGGSRGIGELVAKIIAAGGGKVTITFAVGESEAQALVDEVTAHGGHCRAIRYDVRKDDPEGLFTNLADAPTHIYYFATPAIFHRNLRLFSQDRFDEFNAFYVTGFYRVIQAALGRSPGGITAFYPSSVAVADRPAGMTEYAMSKAAGELLCADINAYMKNVHVVVTRLPRLPTDQTATFQPVEAEDPLTVMLPIVRRVQKALPQ
jgi:NAD(P)-dependent dehydrogenase (short-subunit alcohol dehydrogenase family)